MKLLLADIASELYVGQEVINPILGKGIIEALENNSVLACYRICQKKTIIKYEKQEVLNSLLSKNKWNLIENQINKECQSCFMPGHLLCFNKIIDRIIDNNESGNYYLIRDMIEVILVYKIIKGLSLPIENKLNNILDRLELIDYCEINEIVIKARNELKKDIINIDGTIIPKASLPDCNIITCDSVSQKVFWASDATPSHSTFSWGENTNACKIVQRAEKEKIKEIIDRRNITSIIHFTRVENLPSIIEYGIMPSAELKQKNIEFISNDSNRFDNRTEFSSFSISYPNYKMFYSVSNSNKEQWCILEISPEILLSDNNIVMFFDRNAACSESKSENISKCVTAQSFESMFAEYYIYKGQTYIRSNLGLQSYHTTNPQAEVMISGIIDCQYINKCYFYNEHSLRGFLMQYGYRSTDFSTGKYFSPRCDYEFWR